MSAKQARVKKLINVINCLFRKRVVWCTRVWTGYMKSCSALSFMQLAMERPWHQNYQACLL